MTYRKFFRSSLVSQIALCLFSQSVSAESKLNELSGQESESQSTIEILSPKVTVKKANKYLIDTESFEIGAYAGWLSVEDFNTNTLIGLNVNYHFDSRLFATLRYGSSETKRSPFETIGDFISDRDFTYSSFGIGLPFFSGNSSFGSKRRFASDIYGVLGAESVSFADDDNIGIYYGFTYKAVLSDRLTADVNLFNHNVKLDFLDDDKVTQNTEFSIGINMYF